MTDEETKNAEAQEAQKKAEAAKKQAEEDAERVSAGHQEKGKV